MRQYYAYTGYGPGSYSSSEYAQMYGKSQGNKTRVDPAGIPDLAKLLQELVLSGQMTAEEYMQRLKPKPQMIGGIHPSQFVSPYARYMATTQPPAYHTNIPGYNPDPGSDSGQGSFGRWDYQRALRRAMQTGQLGRGRYSG